MNKYVVGGVAIALSVAGFVYSGMQLAGMQITPGGQGIG